MNCRKLTINIECGEDTRFRMSDPAIALAIEQRISQVVTNVTLGPIPRVSAVWEDSKGGDSNGALSTATDSRR